MITYDLYRFATGNAVIIGWHKFDAADDDAAVTHADKLENHGDFELMAGVRLVKRWRRAPKA